MLLFERHPEHFLSPTDGVWHFTLPNHRRPERGSSNLSVSHPPVDGVQNLQAGTPRQIDAGNKTIIKRIFFTCTAFVLGVNFELYFRQAALYSDVKHGAVKGKGKGIIFHMAGILGKYGSTIGKYGSTSKHCYQKSCPHI